MISVVVPTLNDERGLAVTLASLVPAVADGMVRDAIVVDAGSADGTRDVVDAAGADLMLGPAERAARLALGAGQAKGPWLLFLLPGTVLESGWHHEARSMIETLERQGVSDSHAFVFRHAIDGIGRNMRLREIRSWLGRMLTGVPQPEQGLLINLALYRRLGGFRPLPALETADLARRIGRTRILDLRARAFTPPIVRKASILRTLGAGLLALRVPPRFLARLYL